MASRAGFISTAIDVEVIADTRTTVDVIALVPASASPGGIGGTIRNAVTNGGIADVTIDLRLGVNSTADEIVASTRTDSVGVYAFSNLPAGAYTAMLSRSGFLPNAFTVGVVGGTFTGGQDGTMVPELQVGEVQIILTWGATPRDLDAHLTGPKPAGVPASSAAACSSDPARFHLFFSCTGNFSPFPDDFTLDLDDTSSFGPETITLKRRLPGVYRYSVHDFTNGGLTESTALSNSGAQVRVFIGGGQPLTFNVPPGMPGTVWTVFELDGQTGAITPINGFRFESNAANIGSF
jgi:Carboxypeptidase regulatory-like domain